MRRMSRIPWRRTGTGSQAADFCKGMFWSYRVSRDEFHDPDNVLANAAIENHHCYEDVGCMHATSIDSEAGNEEDTRRKREKTKRCGICKLAVVHGQHGLA